MPDDPAPPAPDAAVLTESAACPACGYSLGGLALTGTCPECGEPYTADSLSTFPPPPSPGSMSLRLGWPLLTFAIAVGLSLLVASVPRSEGMACLFLPVAAAMVLAMLITVPVVASSLVRTHLHPKRRGPSLFVNLLRLGRAPFFVALISLLLSGGIVLALLVTAGACLFRGFP